MMIKQGRVQENAEKLYHKHKATSLGLAIQLAEPIAITYFNFLDARNGALEKYIR